MATVRVRESHVDTLSDEISRLTKRRDELRASVSAAKARADSNSVLRRCPTSESLIKSVMHLYLLWRQYLSMTRNLFELCVNPHEYHKFRDISEFDIHVAEQGVAALGKIEFTIKHEFKEASPDEMQAVQRGARPPKVDESSCYVDERKLTRDRDVCIIHALLSCITLQIRAVETMSVAVVSGYKKAAVQATALERKLHASVPMELTLQRQQLIDILKRVKEARHVAKEDTYVYDDKIAALERAVLDAQPPRNAKASAHSGGVAAAEDPDAVIAAYKAALRK